MAACVDTLCEPINRGAKIIDLYLPAGVLDEAPLQLTVSAVDNGREILYAVAAVLLAKTQIGGGACTFDEWKRGVRVTASGQLATEH